MSLSGSYLYFGNVRHARYQPKKHKFNYRVFSALLDLDKLETEVSGLRSFSINRFNLFSFRYRDHGFNNDETPRKFVDHILAQIERQPADQVFLLCYPRMLGFAFNPLSVYYALVDGKIDTLIYEVRNTFGEDHVYVVPMARDTTSGKATNETPEAHSREKKFHVSPFMDVEGEYHFSAPLPTNNIRLVIRETLDDKPLLIASFTGKQAKLSDQKLMFGFIAYPLMTVKILVGIHFEAARLFLKKLPFYSKPKPSYDKISF